MIGVETKGSVLDAIVDEKSGGSTQFLLENRVNLLALSLFLDLKIVNHGKEKRRENPHQKKTLPPAFWWNRGT